MGDGLPRPTHSNSTVSFTTASVFLGGTSIHTGKSTKYNTKKIKITKSRKGTFKRLLI